MRFILLSICILICPALGISQSRTDSLYVFEQDRTWIGRSILSPIFSTDQQVDSYGEVQLDQLFDSGALRMAQQAYSKKVVTFAARGFNRLGRFKIGADFQFNSQLEDSLANSLRNDLDPLTTYYSYASKSGHYRRQNYKMNTLLSYQLHTNVIPFVHLDYHKHWTAGTVDPRVKSDRFILKIKPGVAIRMKKHSLSASINVGKADETVSVQYVNDDFKFSTLYPDRIHHSNYGYGYSAIRDSAVNYKYDTYKGTTISYQLDLSRWILQADYDYQYFYNTNQFYPRTSTYHTGPRAIFQLYSSTGSFYSLFRASERMQHALSASYTRHNGHDGSLPASGSLDIVNYKVDENTIEGSYSLLLDKPKRFAKEFGLSFRHYQISRVDLSQSVDLAAASVGISAFTNLYLRSSGSKTYKLGLRPYIVLPNSVSFQYSPLSINDFVTNVVNTDYHYYQLRRTGVILNVEYITSLFAKNNIGFYSTVDYCRSNKSDIDGSIPRAFDPSGQRIHINVGARMYINAL